MPAGRLERAYGLEDFVEEGRLIHFVVMMLMPYVASDDELINANGRDEVTSGPEGVAFVESVHSLDLFLEPSGGFPFDHLHDVGDGVSWGSQDTEVDMIILDIEFDHFPVFPFADGFNGAGEFLFHLVRG